jgi:malonate transporter
VGLALNETIVWKLLAILAVVGVGYAVGRSGWLARRGVAAEMPLPPGDSTRMLANAAFYLFSPALLFRTTARLDLNALPVGVLVAYFVPTLAWLAAVYAVARWRSRRLEAGPVPQPHALQQALSPAAPGVQALALSFGNTLYLGIPVAAALFGEAGLGLHVTLISVHALLLFSGSTALIERDLAVQRQAQAVALDQAPTARWATVRVALRNTFIHPVVLPVLCGLAWNLTGLGLHAVVDEVLLLLSAAVSPLCLLLIGLSLAHGGWKGQERAALTLAALKLLALPALVLVVARGVYGLQGLPLSVVVMAAALPIGNNALLFAQRYQTLVAPVAAGIVLSTALYAFTLPAWLALLAHLA